ncbi:hypothetical protein HDU91_001345 [Kappamyces sp. JEL0680]|nr:hypothetical protein HDU91_001345 [Kappamyces sp. JEL0680]
MSFSQLFRSSPFASFHPGQVIKKSARADLLPAESFGVKHPIYTTNPKTSSVTITDMDDALLKKPNFKSAWNKVSTFIRWQENFGSGVVPKNSSPTDPATYSSNIRGLLNAKTNQLKSELGLLQKMDKNTTGSATRTRDSLQRLAQQFQDEPSKKE